MEPALFKINLSKPRLAVFDKVWAVEAYIQAQLRMIQAFNLTGVTIPEFGFCNVCQPLDCKLSRMDAGQYINLHQKRLKQLLLGACPDCLRVVWTDERFCYLLRKDKVVLQWMPLHMRN